ncbi:hypothetical protein [Streptomyces sp. NPDC057877]|uniref:hypothetical protein n=1 Tax=Streptomyces sp. NPDC057877 TaxID=3346269 RepID=UPI00369DF514
MRHTGGTAVGLLALLATLGVAGCSDGDGEGDKGGGSVKPSKRMHAFTEAPCSLIEGKPLAGGMVFRAGTDSTQSEPREDAALDTPEAYRSTTCYRTLGTPAEGGDLWDLTTSADLYERVGPACRAKRIKEDLDRVGNREPHAIDDFTYWQNVEEDGKVGRELLLCDGNLLLKVTAFAPSGSQRDAVDDTLAKLVEEAAQLTEKGLREPAA